MIKKVEIKNFKGIKNMNVSFELKNIQDKSMANQIITIDGDAVSLCPTIIAKNASGKTSFILALDFLLRFGIKESIIKEISFYARTIIFEAFFLKNNVNDTSEINPHNAKKQNYNLVHKLIKNLFNEIHFINSNNLEVNLKLANDKKIGIFANEEDFIIKGFSKNNKDLSLFEILYETLDNVKIGNTPKINIKHLNSVIEKILSDMEYDFDLAINHNSHLYASIRKSKEDEIKNKYKLNSTLQTLTKYFGNEAVKTFLRGTDSSIKNIYYDVESDEYEMSTFTTGDTPISARNLSYGTQKILILMADAVPLFQTGGVLLIDEIENGLHLSLVKILINLFEDEEINKGKAQIIMTTHNPLLFEKNIINSRNAIIYDKSLKQLNELNWKRTEDKNVSLKSKNFYNEIFWLKNEVEDPSTISNYGLTFIINALHKGKTSKKAANGKKH